MRTFTDNLNDMMDLRDISAYHLARKTNVSRNNICLMRKGVFETQTLRTIKELAKGLKCTPGWLLRK